MNNTSWIEYFLVKYTQLREIKQIQSWMDDSTHLVHAELVTLKGSEIAIGKVPISLTAESKSKHCIFKKSYS
jgi:hypothetical protein